MVSNTVGSNTFDVLLPLGVPWLIKAAAEWNAPIEISSGELFVSCVFIVGSVAIPFFVLYLNGWVLNQKVGYLYSSLFHVSGDISVHGNVGIRQVSPPNVQHRRLNFPLRQSFLFCSQGLHF